MFCGVVVQSISTIATMTEMSPIETMSPLIRLLRVKRNSVWSTASPRSAITRTASGTATGYGIPTPSVRYQVI